MTTLIERLLNTVSSRFRVNAGDWFVGDLTLQQGENVDLQKVGNVVTVNASLASKTRLRGNAAPYVSGDLTLASGSGIDIAQVGSTITLSSSASVTGVTSIQSTDGPDLNTPFSGEIYFEGNGCEVSASDHVFTVIVPPRTRLRANAGAYVAGDLSFVGAGGASVSEAGGTFSFRALPAPYTAALSGGDLLLTAPAAAGAVPAIRVLGIDSSEEGGQGGHLDLWAGSAGDPEDGGTGGDLRLAFGGGGTRGALRIGAVEDGAFVERWSFDEGYLRTPDGFFIRNGVIAASDLEAFNHFELRQMHTSSTLAAAIASGLSAFQMRYSFSDAARIPFEARYDRAIVSGKLVHKQAVNSKIRVEVDPVHVDTASTTATTISSYTLGVNEMVTVTSTLQHDNGTTNGRTVYTHTFRSNGAGTVTATGSAEDMSIASKALGHTQTITATSGVISVKVVAAAATATKHRGQVSYEIGSNA